MCRSANHNYKLCTCRHASLGCTSLVHDVLYHNTAACLTLATRVIEGSLRCACIYPYNYGKSTYAIAHGPHLTHSCTHAHACAGNTHMRTRAQKHTHTHTHTCVHAQTQTHAHTRAHTHTHTHTRTHTVNHYPTHLTCMQHPCWEEQPGQPREA